MKKLGQVRRSQFEDICVLLREFQRVPHVELRVYRRSVRVGGDSLPGPEGIAVPVSVLPDLLRVLAQTLERLVQDGLVDSPSNSGAITMETGEPVPVGLRAITPRSRRGDCRRERRVPLKLRIGCRLLDSTDLWSSKEATGETEDVSNGGAQVWLSERFSLFSRVEVSMRVGELTFQGGAEVVGAEVRPTHGGYRHSLRWLDLTAKAKEALSQAIAPS